MKFTFRTFSMQDSQDFQYLTPRIFNLFRFFNLSINMRNFVELVRHFAERRDWRELIFFAEL